MHDDRLPKYGFVTTMCRNLVILSTVAYTSTLALTFHTRWAVHSTALSQYEALATSAICSNPHLRVQSEQVNNCATAERIARGGALSPATLALLETLQRLSLCAGDIDQSGTIQNRCDLVVESLAAASTKIIVLFLIIICLFVWMMRQYYAVSAMRSAHLPLDVRDYPNSADLPPWLPE
jgi:hypothetical protein